MKLKTLESIIQYTNNLEKAYKLINDTELEELEEVNDKIKKLTEELSFIINDIDEKFQEEFYGIKEEEE